MSFGIGEILNVHDHTESFSGAFPFGFFASNFNFGEERPGPPQVCTWENFGFHFDMAHNGF